jgi:DNA-binding NarL/FixJ family response regulator
MGVEDLTERELQIWKYVVQGLPISQIAKEMGANSTYIRVKLRTLCKKLGISNEPLTPRHRLLYEAAQEYLTK